MDYQAILSMVGGLFIPVLVGLLSRKSLKSWIKALITGGISLVVGFATVLFGGEIAFTATNIVVIIGATLGAAAASFWYIVRLVPGLQEWLYNHGIKDKTA